MIDVHCHLEQENFLKDRDEVIEKCKKKLKAIITCCAHPRDFELTMKIVDKYKNFIFASCGIHPEYIKEVSEKEIDNFLDTIVKNKEKIFAIGESGLDFWFIKEKEWQEKQKELFIEFISLAKELNKPLVVHSRDAYEETLKILGNEDAKNVLMHLFGAHNLVKEIVENDWHISIGPIVLKSKKHKKIARDMPLEKILLETDSPWFGISEERGYPTNIKFVAEKIAEIKKLNFEEIWEKCGENAVRFFKLPISIF